MRRKLTRPNVLLAGGLTAVIAIAIPVALAATSSATLTPSSIGGAKLGLGQASYRKLLGGPVSFQRAQGGSLTQSGFQQPSDYTRLVFPKTKVDVYFRAGVESAIELTTWNRAFRTAEGVGPCSTFAQVKKAYGSGLKPNRLNTINGKVFFSYLVGRSLIFVFSDSLHGGTPSRDVTAVALYDGSAPGWNQPGGAMAYAGYVAQAPYQQMCDHS